MGQRLGFDSGGEEQMQSAVAGPLWQVRRGRSAAGGLEQVIGNLLSHLSCWDCLFTPPNEGPGPRALPAGTPGGAEATCQSHPCLGDPLMCMGGYTSEGLGCGQRGR